MQALNLFHGGSLVRVTDHVAVRHPIQVHRTDGIWDCPAVVNSFHDFGIVAATLGKDLSAVAWSDDTIEAIVHGEFKHSGMMWHPERGEDFSVENVQIFRRALSGNGVVVCAK
jgi:putative glutamine amidotransferase